MVPFCPIKRQGMHAHELNALIYLQLQRLDLPIVEGVRHSLERGDVEKDLHLRVVRNAR